MRESPLHVFLGVSLARTATQQQSDQTSACLLSSIVLHVQQPTVLDWYQTCHGS